MHAKALLILAVFIVFLSPAARAASFGESAEKAALDYFREMDPTAKKPRLPAARYMEDRCVPVDPGWASSHKGFERYSGLPVERCFYSRSQTETKRRPAATLIAVVWMLNPDAETLSRWIGSACDRIRSSTAEQCGRKAANYILGQNGAQFAIAGHVLETQSEAGCEPSTKGCEGDVLIYLPFRDGVTVTMTNDPTDGRRKQSFANEQEALEAAEATLTDRNPFRSVGDYGRIANLSRLPSEKKQDRVWLARNRDTYLDALHSPTYKFFAEAVRSGLK